MKEPKSAPKKVEPAELPPSPHAYKDYPPPEHAKPKVQDEPKGQVLHSPAPVPFVPPPKAFPPASVVPWLDQAGDEIAKLERGRKEDPSKFSRKPRVPGMPDQGFDGEGNVRAALLADALADLARRARDIIVT